MVILAVVLLQPVSAQAKETLAVLDFKTEAVSATEMNAIVEFLSAELFNTDKFIVIDVSQRQTILSEMEFSMQGCTDDSCALEIGKLLSAELIVTGNLSKVGSRYLMSVKLLQTETSRTMGTANGKFTDLDELIDGLEAIAWKLTGEELTAKDSVEAEPEPEPEPEPADEAEAEAESEAVAVPVKAPEVERESGSGDVKTGWLPFTLICAGAVNTAAGGVFSALAVSDMLEARALYDLYMATEENPGTVYSGDGDDDYEHAYSLYERDTLISMITSGLGGAAGAASGFTGDTVLSFGGRLSSACGVLFLTAGNFMGSMSANTAVSGERLYENYMSAEDSTVIDQLYAEYQYYHRIYTIERILGYSFLGLGAAGSAGAFFIPGEKQNVRSGLLNRILAGAGYLMLAAGNYANTAAFTGRISAEDAFDDYQSAGTEEAASALYDTYQGLYKTYVIRTAVSYGLWGLGGAAVIASLFIPEAEAGTGGIASEVQWSIRPSAAGAGLAVEIRY